VTGCCCCYAALLLHWRLQERQARGQQRNCVSRHAAETAERTQQLCFFRGMECQQTSKALQNIQLNNYHCIQSL
jgi:hypothetical protein